MEKLDSLHKLALLVALLGIFRAMQMQLGDVVMLAGVVLGGFLFRRYFQRRQ